MVTVIRARARGWMPRSLCSAVVVGCAVAIASCGSSGKPRSAIGASSYSHLVAYADCMRSHGVPNFPDATPDGGFDIPPSVSTQSPAYQVARHTCTKLQPGATVPPPMSEGQRRGILASAKCMRKHGVSVADPTFQGPFITLDEPDQATIQSPAFKGAEAACDYPVPRNVGPAVSP
jgi:hypothetical protein